MASGTLSNHPSNKFVWLYDIDNNGKSKCSFFKFLSNGEVIFSHNSDFIDSNINFTLSDLYLSPDNKKAVVSRSVKNEYITDSFGTIIGIKNIGLPYLIVYDFDNETGLFSNPFKIEINPSITNTPNLYNNRSIFGSLEFSDSSNYFYTALSGSDYENIVGLYQCPVNLNNDTILSKFCTKISENNKIGFLNSFHVGDIKRAPNSKIYITQFVNNDSALSVINNPNIGGIASNFSSLSIKLPSPTPLHFPRILPSLYYPEIKSLGDCNGDTISFWITYTDYDSISWDFGDGNSVTKYTDTVEHVYRTSGLYRVFSKIYKNNILDTATFYKEIHYIEKPQLGNDTLICKGNSLFINVFSTNYDNYKWSNDSTQSAIAITKEGTYRVEVGNKFCNSSDTIFVGLVDCKITANNFCLKDFTLIKVNDFNVDSVYWDFGDGTHVMKPGNEVYHQYSNIGKYIVSAVLFHAEMSIETESLEIEIVTIPMPLLPQDTTACNLIKIKAKEKPEYSYRWSTGDTSSTVLINNSGVYKLEISYLDCKANDSIIIELIKVTKPILPSDTSICEPILIKAQTINPNYSYLWNTGETGAEILAKESGLYILTAFDFNCTNSDSIEITKTFCDCDIYIPNAFSPFNHDNLNDKFNFTATCPITIKYFRIFDRWGNMLFESFSEKEGWDGTYQGATIPIGINFYFLSVETTYGKSFEFKGTVTLIR